MGRRLLWIISVAATLVFLAFAPGCTAPPISAGRAPPTDRLALLQIGVSGEADVQAALGQPRGRGVLQHTSKPETRRNVWFYEFFQQKEDQVGLKMLLIFFDAKTYDGHLWFSAKELLRYGEY